ncbi:MAG: DnaD domain protein [Clostridia bacterium]|nr:DnaD domain protein [Clostridia bacterium]
MKYEINLGAWNRIFAVPAAVVDDHLKLAGSAQLKVLLWVLRHAGTMNEAETIGKALGLSRADVCDAMQYWTEAGLLVADDGTLTPPAAEPAPPPKAADVPAPSPAAEVEKPVQPAPPATPPSEEPADPKPRRTLRPRQLSTLEVTERINGTDEIRYMIDAAESIFARPLTTPEMGALVNLHDWDGLPSDVIIMIIQYALSNGKCNMSYIEKMAVSWAAEGINTHEKAEAKVRWLDERNAAWNRISRLFGIEKRPPSAAESEAVTRWITEWKFTDDMLREAYNRCVDSTGKVKFNYINKILERWFKQNLRTLQDVRAENERKPEKTTSDARPAGKPQAPAKDQSYDLDDFEKMTLYEDLIPQ